MRKDSLTIVRCSHCDMKYLEDSAVIAPDYYQTEADKFYVSDDKVRGDYAPHRYDREINALDQYCSGGRVLDIGCSTGGFLHQVRLRFDRRYDLFGTDVAPSATAIAQEHGVKIIPANFLSDGFPEHDFQAITFWAVLEHLLSPSVYLRKACELLTPGGLVFVVVPNVQSFALRILGARYRYVMAEHVNYFSAAALAQLFASNFEPVRITTSHFNPIVIAQDFFRRSAPKPSERARLLNQTNAMKSNTLLKPLYGCYRVSEAILARTGLADNVLAVFQKRLIAI